MEITFVLLSISRRAEALRDLMAMHAPMVQHAEGLLRTGHDGVEVPTIEALESLEEMLYSYFEALIRFAGDDQRSRIRRTAEMQVDRLRPLLAGVGHLIRKAHKVGDSQSAIAEHERARAARVAGARWIRLTPVKELAFQRRRELSHLSRAAAIKRMLPEILAASREAKEPLTGGDPTATVTRWFREAGIK